MVRGVRATEVNGVVVVLVDGESHTHSPRLKHAGGPRTSQTATGEQQQYDQVRGLPLWMHGVPEDAWWKILEMMGLW